MSVESRLTLDGRIKAYKRRYRKALQDMAAMIEGELKHIDDDIFEPSSAIDSAAFHIIQESSRLKSLLEVEE